MADTYNMSDVFISYSRRNTDFVRRLFDDIKAEDKEVWADFEDIPKTADWWREIQAGIDAADAFIFVISPDSVRSEICRKEIDHAVDVNKRLLPLLYEEIIDEADKEAMHPAISSHNWIFFREDDDYNEAFKILLESIETDLDHNRTHSRLLVRAKEWQENNKNDAYLLQGDDLEQAGDWLNQAYQKTPRPADLHIQYIEASRDARASRQRRLLSLVSAGLVIAILLALFAAYQTVLAQQARDEAIANANKARSLALAASSSQALDDNNPDLAIALAREAVTIDDSQPQVYTALADAAYNPGTRAVFNSSFKLIYGLAYAPDGSTVAVGLETGEICLYATDTGETVRCLEYDGGVIPHEDDTQTLAYQQDGAVLMSMSADAIHLWNLQQGGAVMESFYADDIAQDAAFYSAALSEDGSQLLIGYDNGDVALHDLPGAEVYFFENLHDGNPVTAAAFNQDGSHALTGDDSGVIKYLELGDEPLVLSTLRRHRGDILSLRFIPDTSLAVSGGGDAVMYTWDLTQSRPVSIFEGHDSGITQIRVSPVQQTIFSSSWDNSIREWDFDTGRQIRSYYGHSGGINDIALSPDGSQLISGGYDTDLRLWDVNSFVNQQRLTSPIPAAASSAIYGTDVFLGGFEDGRVIVFDRETDTAIGRSSVPGFSADDPDSATEVVDMLLLPESNQYLTLYDNNLIVARDVSEPSGDVIWQVDVSETISDIAADNTPITPDDVAAVDLALHPDHSEWLVVDETNGLLRYTADNGTFIERVPHDTPATFLTAAYHPDGENVLIGLNDRIFNLHQISLEAGEILQTFEGHADGILAIDFNAESTQMATGAFDNRLIVWDLASGELVRQFEGHSDRVADVAFNPTNSQQVASASNDRTMKLWNMETGFEIFTYEGHTGRVIDVQFAADGATLLTASTDGSLIRWRQPQELSNLLDWMDNSRYIRELSCLEREQYLNEPCDITDAPDS